MGTDNAVRGIHSAGPRREGVKNVRKIDEYWWVPVMGRWPPGRATVLYRLMRTTRKQMIRDFIDTSYSGKHDWNYRHKLGWRAVRVRVFGTFE